MDNTRRAFILLFFNSLSTFTVYKFAEPEPTCGAHTNMTQDWQKSDPISAPKIIERLNRFIEPVSLDIKQTTVRSRSLPFYQNLKFYELTDLTAVPAARKYALANDNHVYMINWTNAPIYAANTDSPLSLNEKNITDYVRFFFSYVRGRHGRFIVIETLDDIQWQNEPPAQGRKMLQEILHPVALIKHENNRYTLECFMLFKDSLFRTLVHVDQDGTVDMSDEELKIEGMPVIQDVTLA